MQRCDVCRQATIVGLISLLIAHHEVDVVRASERHYPITNNTLRHAAGKRFEIGVGAGMAELRATENRALIAKNFTCLTPEDCMKFESLQPYEGDWRFELADQTVQFAQANNLKLIGHCLVWANDDRIPAWLFRDGHGPVSADLLMQRMKTHIKAVVERYRDSVSSWDVVNEAIGDQDEEYLRESLWVDLLGESFIVEAFRYTRQLDPEALLIYNDYGLPYCPNGALTH